MTHVTHVILGVMALGGSIVALTIAIYALYKTRQERQKIEQLRYEAEVIYDLERALR